MISASSPLILIGCGNMGGALVSGWCAQGVDAGALRVVASSAARAQELAARYPVSCDDSIEAIPDTLTPAAFCLAVKPSQLAGVLAAMSSRFAAPNPLILSVVAGKTLRYYRERLWEGAQIVRIMPNTPARIGLGMSSCIATPNLSVASQALTNRLMEAVGRVTWLEEEAQMDAATAIAGSGPAYVFYFMECLMDAALSLGLTPEQARLLVVQTVRGAAQLASECDDDLDILRQNVTSPNGTTAAGLSVLMQKNPKEILTFLQYIRNATQSAAEKSSEMSKID